MNRKTQGIVLAALLYAALVAAVCTDLVRTRNERIAHGRSDAAAMGYLVTQWLDGSFREVDYVVRNLADEVGYRDLPPHVASPARARAIRTFLQLKKDSLPHSVEIGVFDRHCRLRYALQSPIGWDGSQRDYCQALQRRPQQDHFTTPLLYGNLDQYEVLHVRPVTDPQGRLAGLAAVSLDLRFFQRWLDRLHGGSRDMLLVFDTNGKVLASRNAPETGRDRVLREPALRALLTRSARPGMRDFDLDLDGRHYLAVLHPPESVPFFVLSAVDEGALLQDWNASVVQFGLGLLVIGILVCVLLQQLFRSESQAALLYRQATRDSMTRVSNRRHFLAEAEQALLRAQRNGTSLAWIMLDIDHFKQVNDLYGHSVGDRAIVAVAQACRSVVRESDLLGRLGGDEFAILLDGADAEGARRMAERVLLAIRAARVENGRGGDLHLRASLGVVHCARAPASVEAALHAADQALYVAKGAGRDGIHFMTQEQAVD